MTASKDYLSIAIRLAHQNVIERGGRPFGAVIAKDGKMLATGVNEMHVAHDPSTHAEMQAIRAATAALKSLRLDGCALYASGHPCPMCLSLMHMIGIEEVYYAYSNDDAEKYDGLSTAKIYEEMTKPLRQQSIKIEYVRVRNEDDPYEAWQRAR